MINKENPLTNNQNNEKIIINENNKLNANILKENKNSNIDLNIDEKNKKHDNINGGKQNLDKKIQEKKIEENSELIIIRKEDNSDNNNKINEIKNDKNEIKPDNLLSKQIEQNKFNQIKELFNNNDNGQSEEEFINPNDFKYLSIIGEGEYGKIYWVQNINNPNEYYAMKVEIFQNLENAQKNLVITGIIKDFLKETNSLGVINIYSDVCLYYNNLYYYYVLMETAERDMEQELTIRCKYNQFFTEIELINVLCQLILVLAEMQKHNIAHRDIKPQNILIIQGRFKISDFGSVIKLNNTDGNIIQEIAGSELYMSPIVFYGLRHNLQKIKHNVYKSDVFSLGYCILLAGCLNYNILVKIRELTDMNQIKNVLIYYLSGRYSNNLISFLIKMIDVDENKRPDFIQLESMLVEK